MAIKPQHGHWGELFVNAVLIAEVTAIEYTVEIERVDVPQVGTTWTYFHEGLISGNGELRIHKTHSDFESSFLPYVTMSPSQLRAARNAGTPIRPETTIKIALDDPRGVGREYETLTGVKFWQYTGGFDSSSLVGRTWPFSFTGIIAPPDSRILRNGSATLY